MELNEYKICEYDLLQNEIVFIDGLTRVGKSMLNTIVASLEDVSHPQFIEPLEQLLPMYKTGHLSKNGLSAFLRLYLNERFYNFALSRNMNFRYDDLTSIHNSNESLEFFKNLSKNDGDDVIKELKNKRLIHQYQTHDILTHYTLFLDLDISVKVLELFRNPIDTIHSWYKRGWGTRFDQEDPRSFTSLYKYKDKTLPHYAIGREEEYFSLNEMEKCVFLHNILLKKSINEYDLLNEEQKDKILLIRYENILLNPDEELSRIGDFLNTTKSELTSKSFIKARLPREIDEIGREKKFNEIKDNVNKQLVMELEELVFDYDKNLYGLEK